MGEKKSKHIVFIEASSSGAGEVANQYAQKRGCLVTLLTRNPSSYSESILQYVDQVVETETNDIESVVSEVRQITKKNRIDGITTTLDFYVPQATAAAQSLKLPSLTYKAASEVRNKYKMRLNLEASCPELNPLFRLVENLNEALETAHSWGYPIIAKPQDGNDSLYVKLIRDDAELIEYMDLSQTWGLNSAGQPFAKGVLLEQFLQGEEFSVETMQSQGAGIQLIGVFRKMVDGVERGHFIKLAASFPVVTNEARTLFEAVSTALSRLSIDCGVIHTECRMVNGQPKILEINPRLAGGQFSSHVIELALGKSTVPAVVDIALGETASWQPTDHNGAAIYRICASKPGYFYGIENREELEKIPGVVYVTVLGKIGKWFDLPTSSEGFLASIITKAETPEKAFTLAREVAHKARVNISDQEIPADMLGSMPN